MRRRLVQWILSVLLVFLVGGHWTVLQTVAWMGMAISYAQEDPLPVALKKTFDGRHPCSLCEVVRHGKKEEKRQHRVAGILKLEFVLDSAGMELTPPRVQPPVVAVPTLIAIGPSAPPRPPPRLA